MRARNQGLRVIGRPVLECTVLPVTQFAQQRRSDNLRNCEPPTPIKRGFRGQPPPLGLGSKNLLDELIVLGHRKPTTRVARPSSCQLRSHNICVTPGGCIMHVCFDYAPGCDDGVQTKDVKWDGAHLMLRSIASNAGMLGHMGSGWNECLSVQAIFLFFRANFRKSKRESQTAWAPALYVCFWQCAPKPKLSRPSSRSAGSC
jgi:hypothetical protein